MPTRRDFLGATLAASTASLSSAAEPTAPDERVPLTPTADGGFEFDTPVMSGRIEPSGAYHGLKKLVHKPTGRQWIDSRYSALNLFKLQSVNLCMGQPRILPSQVTSTDKSVTMTWPATPAHQGEVVATWEVRDTASVDLTITVTTTAPYAGYEVFMSSYFDNTTKPHLYLKQRFPTEPEQLVAPMVNDVFRNCLLVFPRDSNAARLCVDGRWDRNEGDVPTVQNIPVRHYSRALGFLTDPDKKSALVMMSRPRDTIGISTRYFADKPEDRQTSYSAFDFSLCGENLASGDTRTLSIRLTLTDLDEQMSQPLGVYESFLNTTV
jgi:hypothetical protein